MAEQVKKEKKVMTRECVCAKSKAGNLYLYSEKNGVRTFVNLVKDNKKYTPKLKEGNSYDVEFTSYDLDKENHSVTLFDVRGI